MLCSGSLVYRDGIKGTWKKAGKQESGKGTVCERAVGSPLCPVPPTPPVFFSLSSCCPTAQPRAQPLSWSTSCVGYSLSFFQTWSCLHILGKLLLPAPRTSVLCIAKQLSLMLLDFPIAARPRTSNLLLKHISASSFTPCTQSFLLLEFNLLFLVCLGNIVIADAIDAKSGSIQNVLVLASTF